MAKYYRDLVPWKATYLSGSTAACGTVSTAVTVPSGATSAFIHAEGAACYYSINAASAASTSPGYIAQDLTGYIPPLDNLGTLYVIGAGTAAVAHVNFFRD